MAYGVKRASDDIFGIYLPSQYNNVEVCWCRHVALRNEDEA